MCKSFSRISGAVTVLLLMQLGFAFNVYAQQFGGNPPSIKWRQINIPAARIIFPTSIDTTAFKVANIINRVNGAVRPSIGYRQKLINIVLQNQTLISNGYVGLAPFRSEFYLTPEQNSFDLGSLPFAEQLAVHEFRHVQQFNNFDVGLTRALHLVFGEGGQTLGNSLAIPNWFDEGDAVFNETLVTRQGRGRLPYFFNDYRILWAAGKEYSFMKLRNGSYLDIVPNHYPLGYMLVAYGREKYGSRFWKNVGHDAGAFHSLFYPFQSAVEQYSARSFKQFVTDGLNYFKPQMVTPRQQAAGAQLKTLHFSADRQYPVYVDDSTLIYKKISYNNRAVFIISRNGKEKVIRLSDISIDDYFSYQNGKLVYTAYRPDLRWSYRDYNELAVIDIKTGKERRLTTKTKYFAPAFSPGGDTIVAVQAGPSGKSSLHLLSAASGHVITVVPNPNHLYYTYPKFYNSRQLISAVRQPSGRMAIALIDIASGKSDELLQSGLTPVGFPVLNQDTLYFTATSGNSDELYALNISNRQLYKLNSDALRSTIGNYQPAVSPNKIAWVSPSVTGYRLYESEKKSVQLQPVNRIPALPGFNIGNLNRDTAAHIIADTGSTKPLPERRYPKFSHPLNFHSLIPYFDDPDYTLSLQGENILNTFVTELDLDYNRNERSKDLSFQATYGAFFPYLFGGAGYTFNRRQYATQLNENVYWNEKSVQGGLQVPLNFTGGTHITGLTIASSMVYTGIDTKPGFSNLFRFSSYSYSNNTVNFSNRVQQARQNIYPHWAQYLTLNYKGSVSSINARQFLASGSFYLPGLSANHSLILSAAWQQRDHQNNIYTNNFPFSRGYTAANLFEMGKAGINYHFPLAYPDAGVANLVYILRLRANLFFDATRGSFNNSSRQLTYANFRTAGAEVYFDTKWFNQSAITFGIRYSYLLDEDLFGSYGRNRISFIVPLTSL